MPDAGLSATLGRVRRAVAPTADSDGRFLADRDEGAFAELVRRHGPMVLGECRRGVGDRHLADDAFQAVFLTLARRAGGMTGWASVGGWLRAVARRVARNARRQIARRREVPSGAVPQQPAGCPSDQDELGPVVLEELARLPDRFRTLLVLHYLEGRPQIELAARLGLPAGTVNRRMTDARRALGDRLRARGVAPAAAAVALGAALPAPLAARAVAAAQSPDQAPAAVAALSNGVTRTMLVPELKLPALGGLVLALATAAWTAAPAPDPVVTAAAAAPVPDPQPREGVIVVWMKGRAALFRPDGSIARAWQADAVPEPGRVALSPDGGTLAFLRIAETRTLNQQVPVGGGARLNGSFSRHLYKLAVGPAHGDLSGTDVDLPGDSCESVLWSADGTRLYAGTHADDENYSHDNDLRHFVVDAATRKVAPLKLPAGHHLDAVSPDGALFLTTGPRPEPRAVRPSFLVPAAGGRPVPVTAPGEWLYDGRFSPDGKTLLMCGMRMTEAPAAGGGAGGPAAAPPVNPPVEAWLETAPVAAPKTRAKLPLAEKDREYANQCRWSPDGKRVVTARMPSPAFTPRTVVVSDPDGQNRRTIFTDPVPLAPLFIDWR